MDKAIVIYPSPVLTHQTAMVELGKLLLAHQPSLSIHILIATLPQAKPTSPFFSAVPETIPPIIFHKLPTVTDLPPSTDEDTVIFDVMRLNNPHVRHALLTISNNYKINAIIVDFFCSSVALKVASDLDLPTYCFYTTNAGSLASLLYFPTLHKNFNQNFADLNVLVDVPGVPPIPSSDIPTLKRNSKSYNIFLDISTCLLESAGIILNTFESLEPRAIKTIGDGLCAPDCSIPPIYCIGPLIANAGITDGDGVPECLKWLDYQPSKSVVFLSFGSLGSFSIQQLREVAVGLERSGQRFLWVVRNPPIPGNKSPAVDYKNDLDLNSLLPEGFLERTKERGHVVKSWAPQAAVLNHESVGGFVTHCGWNSVLESVCAGVPMVAWPLYAEQRYNRVLLVEEMKMALPLTMESDTGFVNSAEVEKRVKQLMESEEGKSVRERTIAMKHAAKAAVSEGGSSRFALVKLSESWSRNEF
ncbi:hypothetical protein DITRI_Ditri04bG0170500 [Diplodiscus trichospermus]